MSNPGLPIRYFQQPHIDSLQKDVKLGESFYYLPYLGICKSQNVLVNIYCNFANELLCLSELLLLHQYLCHLNSLHLR